MEAPNPERGEDCVRQAADEKDPKKLLELAAEINRLVQEKRNHFNSNGRARTGMNPVRLTCPVCVILDHLFGTSAAGSDLLGSFHFKAKLCYALRFPSRLCNIHPTTNKIKITEMVCTEC